MSEEVEAILRSFESLPDADKRELASEITRRTLGIDTPGLSDAELVSLAGEVLLDLDRNESKPG